MQCIYNLLRPPLRAFIILQTFQDFPTLRFGLPHENQPQKLSGRIWGLHSPILPFRPKDDHSLDSRWCLFTSHADLPTFFPTFAGKVGESSTNWNATHFGDLEEHLLIIGMERGTRQRWGNWRLSKLAVLWNFPRVHHALQTIIQHIYPLSTHCLRVLQQKHMIKLHVRLLFDLICLLALVDVRNWNIHYQRVLIRCNKFEAYWTGWRLKAMGWPYLTTW